MPQFIVVDTETTGFDPETNKVVEIAAVTSTGASGRTLVDPGDTPISFGAMAVHHITQAMVEGAPDLYIALIRVGLVDLDPETVLVFHNAKFDLGFLPRELHAQPWICTYRCALHLIPNAESHSNGALWHECGLAREMPEEVGRAPHRALFDAMMTFDLVEHLITLTSAYLLERRGEEPTREECIAGLVKISTAPVVLKTVSFGKHAGAKWADVPSDYLRWALKQDFDADVRHTCQRLLDWEAGK